MKNHDTQWPDFDTLDDSLIAANTPFSPAYIHGMMVGLLCVSAAGGQRNWQSMQAQVPALVLEDATSELFNTLFLLTQKQLQDVSKGVELMLPIDSYPLSYRLEALAAWCEGFFEGVALENISEDVLASLPTVQEVLTDFAHIKEISFEEQETEENEKDYAQIIEFVRVGVLLVYAECKQEKINHQLLH